MMKSAKDSIKKYDEKNKKNETKGFEHPNKSGSGRKQNIQKVLCQTTLL